MKQSVMILGGYGNFGKRIAELLSEVPSIEVIIAGRHLAKAQQELKRLESSAQAELRAVEVDSQANNLETTLRNIKPTLLIHTVGPFQGQDFRVPKACIANGIHYIDLADDRTYVCSITQFVTGILLMNQRAFSFQSPWFITVFSLFILIGLCWLPVLRIQYRMRALALACVEHNRISAEFKQLMRIWTWLGIPAFMAILVLFWLMVFKPLSVI